jgi:hypothetical protein
MPIISTFFGIVIRIFYRDHEPAHFHAEYQGQQAKFDFAGEVMAGEISSKTARRLIKDGHPRIGRNWKAIGKA